LFLEWNVVTDNKKGKKYVSGIVFLVKEQIKK